MRKVNNSESFGFLTDKLWNLLPCLKSTNGSDFATCVIRGDKHLNSRKKKQVFYFVKRFDPLLTRNAFTENQFRKSGKKLIRKFQTKLTDAEGKVSSEN